MVYSEHNPKVPTKEVLVLQGDFSFLLGRATSALAVDRVLSGLFLRR